VKPLPKKIADASSGTLGRASPAPPKDGASPAGASASRSKACPRRSTLCPGQKPPVWAVKRPARPCKSAMPKTFTVENVKGVQPPREGPDRLQRLGERHTGLHLRGARTRVTLDAWSSWLRVTSAKRLSLLVTTFDKLRATLNHFRQQPAHQAHQPDDRRPRHAQQTAERVVRAAARVRGAPTRGRARCLVPARRRARATCPRGGLRRAQLVEQLGDRPWRTAQRQ
jgi:hypothetical protein